MSKFCPELWLAVVRQVWEQLLDLKFLQPLLIEGEQTAENGGHILKPIRVVLLHGQLGNASQVAEDEEDILYWEKRTFQHVLQTQGGCHVILTQNNTTNSNSIISQETVHTSSLPEARQPSRIRLADWEIAISVYLKGTCFSKRPAAVTIFRYSSCSCDIIIGGVA